MKVRVICIGNQFTSINGDVRYHDITIGKEYDATIVNREYYEIIIDDNISIRPIRKVFFMTIEDYRQEQLNKLL
jgi:hypothetical protein